MPDRKETPDILGQILGGGAAPDQSANPIGTVAAPPRAAPRRKAAAKQDGVPKWEYLTLSCQDQEGWRARFADGEELNNWHKGPPLSELLDALGDDGWELIALTTKEHFYGRADALQAFFKRAKA